MGRGRTPNARGVGATTQLKARRAPCRAEREGVGGERGGRGEGWGEGGLGGPVRPRPLPAPSSRNVGAARAAPRQSRAVVGGGERAAKRNVT